jgi:hypothetical protein
VSVQAFVAIVCLTVMMVMIEGARLFSMFGSM